MQTENTPDCLHEPKPNTILLWMIQPIDLWRALQMEGTLFVNPDFPEGGDLMSQPIPDSLYENFLAAYQWIREQMARRIANGAGNYAWFASDYRPDLPLKGYPATQLFKELALIGLAVSRNHVLLSNLGEWHHVYQRRYLSSAYRSPELQNTYDPEVASWERKASQNGAVIIHHWAQPNLPEPWESQLKESWERIFNLEKRWRNPINMACFERLELADVVEVIEFSAHDNADA